MKDGIQNRYRKLQRNLKSYSVKIRKTPGIFAMQKHKRKLDIVSSSLIVKIRKHPRIYSASACVVLVLISAGFYIRHQQLLYEINASESALIGVSTVDKKLIEQSATSFTYNRADEVSPKDKVKEMLVAGNDQDASAKLPYSAEISKDPKLGITFNDGTEGRDLTLTPQFKLSSAKLDDEGRVIYPVSTTERHIYSYKKNGLKSDITLIKKPKENLKSYSYTLSTGKNLESKMLPNGDIGIYSASPYLFGSLQIADQKSQGMIDKARTKGVKDTLVYTLPRPFITDKREGKNYEDVNYTLKGNVLTLEVRDRKSVV